MVHDASSLLNFIPGGRDSACQRVFDYTEKTCLWCESLCIVKFVLV